MSILSDPEVLEKLSQFILQHLGFNDEDKSLSKFLVSLYDKANKSKDYKTRSETFNEVVRQNGGDEFPSELISSSFEIMDEKVHPIVKEEPKDEMIVKQEDTTLKGLSIPNKRIDWGLEDDREDYIKKENGVKREEQLGIIKQERQVPPKDIELEVGNIYKGYISNLAPYGAFIKLNHPKSNQSGLCHVSKIAYDGRNRTERPEDVVKLNQEVFVKIEKIEKNQRSRDKISLSMRGIDQITGLEDIEQSRGRLKRQFDRDEADADEEERGRNERKMGRTSVPKRRLTSPERWELRQLIASGAISAKDYPELTEEDPNAAFGKAFNKNTDSEVEIDIELNDDEPPFLKGQTKSSLELAPLKIMKNPEGSLGRAAMQGSQMAKEIKETKIKEQRGKEKQERKDQAKSVDTHDPLSKMNSKSLDSTQQLLRASNSEWKKLQSNANYGKRTSLSMKEQRESLPVFGMRSQLVSAIKENQFLVIVGETGSGKTTQIVQYLAEEGMNKGKIIGCTQPRRVAATSVATRVAEEVGCKVGQEVGYSVRFDEKTSPDTVIKYMTDGMLQREALTDSLMSRYSVIMLDEAHERTIATDVLFALLKEAAAKNPDLKIIVTSATLDSEKFLKYFNNCPVMKIPGRTFPVEIMYTREPEMDYLAATLDSVIQIHVSEPQGDILVFLTGQEEIDTSCEALYARVKLLGDAIPELIILPVYSALPAEIQSKIFEPTPEGSRKVIFATNIAETSITIDGIYYVIDPGFVKVNAYDSKLGMDSLIVSPISQAQANQRSGRAGRTGPGKCYRLYTETAFKTEMLPNTIPEIQRQNLSSTILMLKAMGINDLLNFQFMDPPPVNTMLTALQDLYNLEALDDEGYLTRLGRKMADFPMSPALAKTLIVSLDFGCSDEILSIVAMLSVQTIFYRPRDKQQQADQRKARFHHSQGDHLTFLNVYKAWGLSGYSKQWCQDNFIQERSMKRAQEVRRQLATIMRKYRYEIISCGSELDRVRRALCAGFFKYAAKRDGQEGYKSIVEQTPVYMHPSSALFGKNPDYVIYHTMLLTTKEYMHCVTVIDPKWLVELAPAFFKVADAALAALRKKREKIVPLFDRFSKDQNAWRLSSHSANKAEALNNLRDK